MELDYLDKAFLKTRGLLDEEKLAKAYGIRIVYEGSEDGLPHHIEYLTKEEYEARCGAKMDKEERDEDS